LVKLTTASIFHKHFTSIFYMKVICSFNLCLFLFGKMKWAKKAATNMLVKLTYRNPSLKSHISFTITSMLRKPKSKFLVSSSIPPTSTNWPILNQWYNFLSFKSFFSHVFWTCTCLVICPLNPGYFWDIIKQF